MEKVINEWRIIETDDGYRIEIKGDKDAMRKWLKMFKSCGPGFRGRRWKGFGMRQGPWGHHGPWNCGPCDMEEETEEPKEA